MKIKLITEGICKGMKVLFIDFGTHAYHGYYDGKLSDKEIIEKFFTIPKCDSTPIQGRWIYE